MQSCVKFACWVHLYVRVCVCHDSRLIKLLHSNELWLSVWQLLWQPLFTTSPPTQVHTNTHAYKCMHQHEAYHNYEKASMLTTALDAFLLFLLLLWLNHWQSCANPEGNNWRCIKEGGQHTLFPTARATLPLLHPLLCFHPDNDRRSGISHFLLQITDVRTNISHSSEGRVCIPSCCPPLPPPHPFFNKQDGCVCLKSKPSLPLILQRSVSTHGQERGEGS